jgi:hypothetical protein
MEIKRNERKRVGRCKVKLRGRKKDRKNSGKRK